METISRREELVQVYNFGYRIKGRQVHDPKGQKVKIYNDSNMNKYPEIIVKIDNKAHFIPVHRLAAYQKYGNYMFCKYFGQSIVVRHINDRKWNFQLSNIKLGSEELNRKDQQKNKANRRARARAFKQYQRNKTNVR